MNIPNPNYESDAVLVALAEKLGVATEQIWNILVRQAPITATIDLIICTVAVLCWINPSKKLIERVNAELKKDSLDANDFIFMLAIIWLLVTIILTAAVYSSTYNIIAGFFNPEYWALKQIIK